MVRPAGHLVRLSRAAGLRRGAGRRPGPSGRLDRARPGHRPGPRRPGGRRRRGQPQGAAQLGLRRRCPHLLLGFRTGARQLGPAHLPAAADRRRFGRPPPSPADHGRHPGQSQLHAVLGPLARGHHRQVRRRDHPVAAGAAGGPGARACRDAGAEADLSQLPGRAPGRAHRGGGRKRRRRPLARLLPRPASQPGQLRLSPPARGQDPRPDRGALRAEPRRMGAAGRGDAAAWT